MYHEVFDVTAPGNPVLLERVDYDYADRLAPGNVTRITRRPAGAALVQATDLTYGRNGQLWLVTERTWEEPVLWEGDCALDFNGASAAGCCAETVYDVPVPDGACCVVSPAEPCQSDYPSQHYQQVAVDNAQVLSITEFRGQGRARTLVRQRDPLGPSEVLPETAIWHDYDGDEIYGDYLADAAGVATDSASFELGLAQASTGQVAYFQGDQIGSTRQMSNQDAVLGREQVTTAFGEVVFSAGSTDTRYQYAGAHGYENLGLAVLHVGHRYYEPALGRFLQRDPIGIRGGLNVYEYVSSYPIGLVDPLGMIGENWVPTPGGVFVPPDYPMPKPGFLRGRLLPAVRGGGRAAGRFLPGAGLAITCASAFSYYVDRDTDLMDRGITKPSPWKFWLWGTVSGDFFNRSWSLIAR